MEEIARTLAARLQERGVDPAEFLANAPAATAIVAGPDASQAKPVLEALATFTTFLREQDVRDWLPFRYGISHLAAACPGEPAAFLARVEEFAGAIRAMKKAGLDVDAVNQRLPPSLAAAKGKPWLAREALDLARALGAKGVTPAETMQHAFPALAAAAGPDEKRFVPLAAALRDAIAAVAARGIHPTWPIAVGFAALPEAFRDSLDSLDEAYGELAELAIAVDAAGKSPYPVLEHGIPAAFQSAGGEPWLRDSIFPIAFAIVSEPDGDLIAALARIGNLRDLGPERGRAMVARLIALADRGIDVTHYLQTVPLLHGAAGEDGDRWLALLTAAETLLETLVRREERTWKTFDDGLVQSLSAPHAFVHAERVLSLAQRLADRGIEPGPGLQHGVAPAFHSIAEAFEPSEAPALQRLALDAAGEILESGLDPWRFLEAGVFAVARVSRGDAAAFRAMLGETRTLTIDVGRTGVSPDPVLQYGLRNLSLGLSGEEGRVVFAAAVTNLRTFMPHLRAKGIDPTAAGQALGAVAEAAARAQAPWIVDVAAQVGRRLADAGIDPAGLLSKAIPAIARALGDDRERMTAILDDVAATTTAVKGMSLEQVVADAVGDVPDAAGSARAALALIRSAKSRNRNASEFAAIVVPVLARSAGEASSDPKERESILSTLMGAADEALARTPPAADTRAFALAAAAAARVAGVDATALAKALDAAANVESEPLLVHGLRAVADVAGSRVDVFVRLSRALDDRVAEAREKRHDLEPAFVFGSTRAANAAGGREDSFLAVIDGFIRVGARRGDVAQDELGALLLEHAAPLAAIAARGDAGELARSLEDLARLRETNALEGDARRVLPWLADFTDFVRDVPSAWRDLLSPMLVAQSSALDAMLSALHRIRKFVRDDESVSLLKRVVTQEGVRAPEVFWGLLVPGLHRGQIGSLAEEKETILSYLRDVTVLDPAFYAEYRAAIGDDTKSPAEKRAAVKQLNEGVATLAKAVKAGAVPAEKESDPLLAHVLYHVFPPAVSVTHDRYLEMFRTYADHDAHFASRSPRTGEARLPRGGYRVRDGESIDRAPWRVTESIVRVVHASPGAEPLDALGRDLFAAWIDGTLVERRESLLARVYRRHHETGGVLPESAVEPRDLLRHREFLADATREIVQEALHELAEKEPERYACEAKNKLSPRPYVGPGLVKAAWRTVESARSGEITKDVALDRLVRQLKGFELSGHESALLSAERSSLPALLDSLPSKAGEVELGEAPRRMTQDLVGADAAAMQRELFGDGKTKGKLEYRKDADGDALVLQFEVTKRRAHAPIGFCEGVCTAVDSELWADPRFAQCVILGPDGRARGGMHLLVFDGGLALPGINPSLELLAEVGPDPILDALLDFAKTLARGWSLPAVWIPTNPSILSNRGPIHDAITKRDLPQQGISSTRFSYRPYSYSFDRVFVVS